MTAHIGPGFRRAKTSVRLSLTTADAQKRSASPCKPQKGHPQAGSTGHHRPGLPFARKPREVGMVCSNESVLCPVRMIGGRCLGDPHQPNSCTRRLSAFSWASLRPIFSIRKHLRETFLQASAQIGRQVTLPSIHVEPDVSGALKTIFLQNGPSGGFHLNWWKGSQAETICLGIPQISLPFGLSLPSKSGVPEEKKRPYPENQLDAAWCLPQVPASDAYRQWYSVGSGIRPKCSSGPLGLLRSP